MTECNGAGAFGDSSKAGTLRVNRAKGGSNTLSGGGIYDVRKHSRRSYEISGRRLQAPAGAPIGVATLLSQHRRGAAPEEQISPEEGGAAWRGTGGSLVIPSPVPMAPSINARTGGDKRVRTLTGTNVSTVPRVSLEKGKTGSVRGGSGFGKRGTEFSGGAALRSRGMGTGRGSAGGTWAAGGAGVGGGRYEGGLG
ncbi:hypothetical protein BDP27DRAFT_1407359 [Rhodocollybia butyracea]|uniref:Uncharacterized protein n=1 Tax=Rhodocollybia butyracea TaxID=206335 RepID=A0A9P5PAN8_9AGAR|nr:hypothetical protein BDP27DRAFT_1407359 [Rhodocollybia butyracea]